MTTDGTARPLITTPADSAQGASRDPWEQQPGEPDHWYGRFAAYLQLGPARTVIDAYRRKSGRSEALTVSSTWREGARRWRWRERGRAWDACQRDLLALSERNLRVALRQRRVEVTEDYLERVRQVLDNAHLEDADEKQAREWLPQMRAFLRDLLVAQRQEFERVDFEEDDPSNNVLITADDLRAAQRELEAQGVMPYPPFSPAPTVRPQPPDRKLLVCAGADGGLLLDLAALRAVQAATGLRFSRLLAATRKKFADSLRRERGLGRPVELLHLALHASAQGVEFTDGIADGNWLSERLLGVRVLLLAACESDSLGDWLGVVPHVVSISEDIAHEDAAALTQHFWHNIGLGQEPGEALNEALTQCPPAVAEYVVKHW